LTEEHAMKDMQARVGEILLRQWDPIGVADVPQAQDEYDSYVGEIALSVLRRRSVSDIATQLLAIETDLMGLRGDNTRALRVADRLVRLPRS
jgi:hypothetical protein